jgi:glyoxylase-like metal-dependent hydrolase (beta-lactamase superfamily II)
MVQTIRFLEAGHCKQIERFVNPKTGKWKSIRFPNTVAVIEHAKHGIILFDTGYTPRHYEITKKLPASLYEKFVPVTVTPEDTALYQMKGLGIRESDIRTVVLSHFHADHIGGALDFTSANFVYSRAEYERAQAMSTFQKFRHLYFPALLPTDLAQKAIPYGKKTPLPRLGALSYGYDLLGDESIFVIPLPGHSLGHIGLYLPNVQGEEYLLLGDAAWTRTSVLKNIMPIGLASLIVFENGRTYAETLSKLHVLPKEIKLIPCHCHETLKEHGVQHDHV